MENWLIPRLIHDEYLAGRSEGKMRAVTLYIDVSGFTAITERFMRQGVEGAEVLTRLLNQVFEPLIDGVYDRGGFISGFAGDSFTAVFPVQELADENSLAKVVSQATGVALFTVRIVSEQQVQRTPFGDFKLTVKQGLSMGNLEWNILGTAALKTYCFRGEAIEGCSEAGSEAKAGEIRLDQRLRARFPRALKQAKRVVTASNKHDLPEAMDPKVAIQFFPQLVNSASLLASFRSTAIVFISVQRELPCQELDLFVRRVIQLSEQFGGFFNDIEFGDKGCKLEVYFGAPISHENDLECALDFLLALRSQSQYGPVWRAGAAFGTVYAGMLGISRRCKYSVFGNAVNLAARLMTLAEWGQILVPDSLSCWSGYSFEWLGEMSLKGFTEPVAICELQGIRVPSEQEAPTTYEGMMVGRQAELSRLLSAAHVLFEGICRSGGYLWRGRDGKIAPGA